MPYFNVNTLRKLYSHPGQHRNPASEPALIDIPEITYIMVGNGEYPQVPEILYCPGYSIKTGRLSAKRRQKINTGRIIEEQENQEAENEKNGVIYHRQGITGDYDDFNDIEKLIDFIKTGTR